jgi:hypothetical protein
LLDAALEAVLVEGGDERPAAEEQRYQADADGGLTVVSFVVVVAIPSSRSLPAVLGLGVPALP